MHSGIPYTWVQVTSTCMHLKINLPLIFWETIIPIKKFLQQKMCILMRFTTLIWNIFLILHISWDKPKKTMIFMGFWWFHYETKFAPIFTVIFVISASKYINIQKPEENRTYTVFGRSPPICDTCTSFDRVKSSIWLYVCISLYSLPFTGFESHWPLYNRSYKFKVGSEPPEPRLKFSENFHWYRLRNRTPKLLLGKSGVLLPEPPVLSQLNLPTF